MKLLVTGARGFIGKNLCSHIRNRLAAELFEYNPDTGLGLLDKYTAECDFVFHLAGINRPKAPRDFEINYTFTVQLLQSLKNQGNKAPILMSSSIQAELNNPYGNSKKKAEELMFNYEAETRAPVFVFRLPSVFGKWCQPNYNSVVATFCDATANGRPVRIDNPDADVTLIYIDDVVKEFLKALDNKVTKQDGFCIVKDIQQIKVGNLAELIASFRECRNSLMLGNLGDTLTKQLYSTYISYLPKESFSYPLVMRTDTRGAFTEFLKSKTGGQVSVNSVNPGMTKGNHWHHTKSEKILVVSGTGVICFKNIQGGDEFLYPVSGEELKVIDIPVGYAHSITNTGTKDMIMVVWSNQVFDPHAPDTYPMELN